MVTLSCGCYIWFFMKSCVIYVIQICFFQNNIKIQLFHMDKQFVMDSIIYSGTIQYKNHLEIRTMNN